MSSPFGTWPSPITAQVAATQGLRLGAPAVDGSDVYWLEGRPAEGGRNVLVRRARDGTVRELTPPGFNVRTRVHEYGGGGYVVHGGVVVFSNFADQRLYRLDRDAGESAPVVPVPITPEGRWHFADAVVDPARDRLLCVREDHTVEGRECVNTLVGVPLDGSGGAGRVLAEGYDFYATPRLSPDGSRLAWICWRHPNMPWDGTELWVADVDAAGGLTNARHVAGSDTESIYQPGWSAGGDLYFVSDRDDRWRLYVCGAWSLDQATILPVQPAPPADAETGRPQWILGTSTWTFTSPTRLVVSYTREGRWHLGCADLDAGRFRELASELEPGAWLAPAADEVVLVAGSATAADEVIAVHVESGAVRVLRAVPGASIDAGYVSVPESLWFPTDGDRAAQLFYYAPRNRDCTPVAGDRPPLIVISHGGPVAAADSTLDYTIQFWTSRGFAVADVNYGGSTGFGRAYRQRLNRQWGVVDVADCIRAAQFLAAEGKADPGRLVIRGGSAGGFTTLAALTAFPDVFKAGASYYGVSDLEALLHDSHKFEARCLDILVGPYPAAKALYEARSPIHAVDRLSCPLILFQGLEDKVVPPNQSEMMVEALRRKGRPVAYVAFAGEQHGFRKAENIIRSLEAELYFYGAVFGFEPADRIEPVVINNLPP
ncbi:MAG TPA: prolyl oligopeptidase family serine peptidase [Vicinamibacterales bacterium]|nr:prolyl oligopeptidase family serine peptidase [Vicinamibacterales bacterium]